MASGRAIGARWRPKFQVWKMTGTNTCWTAWDWEGIRVLKVENNGMLESRAGQKGLSLLLEGRAVGSRTKRGHQSPGLQLPRSVGGEVTCSDCLRTGWPEKGERIGVNYENKERFPDSHHGSLRLNQN